MGHKTGANAGRRQASFGGVAALFGDEEDDEQEEEQQPSSSYNTEHESVGQLQELPKVNRTKKRDPSFGGVADLFKDDGGDDEEDNDAPAPKFEVKINPTQDKQISALQTQVELSREKAIELEGELQQVQEKNSKLEKELD